MVEIVFNESACVSLKVAQHYGEGTYPHMNLGVIGIHADGSKPTKKEMKAIQRERNEQARLVWENAVPMGGNPADVYGFNLMLSIGDISENQPGIKRKQALEHLYSVYPNHEGPQMALEILERATHDLETVRERVVAGESLRIWYSNQPDEMCGLYWFMEQLSQWNRHDGQVLIIKLPEWETTEEGGITQRGHWGEVGPEGWHRYLPLERPASPVFRQGWVSHWRALQKENAPLRVVLNGQLVSMPETLYDNFILREIATESGEFHEMRLIGRVMINYQLGINDAWLKLRIEEMIHAGKLEVMSVIAEDRPLHHRMLKTCDLP